VPFAREGASARLNALVHASTHSWWAREPAITRSKCLCPPQRSARRLVAGLLLARQPAGQKCTSQNCLQRSATQSLPGNYMSVNSCAGGLV
jgi:hypothetical protein